MSAGGEDGCERLAAAVLVVVEEDLSGAALHRPLQRHIPGPLLQGIAADCFRNRASRVIIELAENRQIQMQSGTTRCLDEDLKAERCQKIAKPEGQITGAAEGAPVELRLFALGLTARVLVRVEI